MIRYDNRRVYKYFVSFPSFHRQIGFPDPHNETNLFGTGFCAKQPVRLLLFSALPEINKWWVGYSAKGNLFVLCVKRVHILPEDRTGFLIFCCCWFSTISYMRRMEHGMDDLGREILMVFFAFAFLDGQMGVLMVSMSWMEML